jgi:hypothetical protein
VIYIKNGWRDMAIQMSNEASLKEIRDGLINKKLFLVGITCTLRECYPFLFKYSGSLSDGPAKGVGAGCVNAK